MTGFYHRTDGRSWLVCTGCGWLHISALPSENAPASCVRCGRASSTFVVASESQFDAVPDLVTVSVVAWRQGD